MTSNILSVMTKIKKLRPSSRKIARRKWKTESMVSKSKQRIQRLPRTRSLILKLVRKMLKVKMQELLFQMEHNLPSDNTMLFHLLGPLHQVVLLL